MFDANVSTFYFI